MPEDDWPALMPGLDDEGPSDHTSGRAQAAAIFDDVGKESVPLRSLFTGAELPAGVRTAAGDALGAVGDVRRQVHQTVARLDALATSDLIPREGRQRVTRETKAVAAAALRELGSRSEGAITIIETGLTAAAQPQFPAGADREEARQELRMLLDAAPDPAEAVRAIAAGSDQRLAGLAVSSYAASYLRAKGVDERTIRQVAVFAAQAGLSSDNPARQAAARALTRLDDLRKLRLKALHAASFAIEWD